MHRKLLVAIVLCCGLTFSLAGGPVRAHTLAKAPAESSVSGMTRAEARAMEADEATPATEGAVKGLSWWEVGSFSPIFKPVDAPFITRLEATSKPKLRYLGRYCAFMAHSAFSAELRAKWKKVAEECKRILGSAVAH